MNNPVRKLRTELGLSRKDLAAALERTEALIASWESEIPDELLRKMALIAEKRGRPDLAREFYLLLGEDKHGAADVDLKKLSPIEAEYASIAVYILRHPEGAVREATLKMLDNERQIQAFHAAQVK